MATLIDRPPAHPSNAASTTRAALLSGISAYLLWGSLPLYLHPLTGKVDTVLIICQRVVWSVVLLALILTFRKLWPDVLRVLRLPKVLGLLAISSLLISTNWLVFTYVNTHGQKMQAAVGYFLTPLLSASFGMIFLRERLRLLQYAALALAILGVAYLTIADRVLPTYALILAFTFSLYGLVRKLAPVDAITGLMVETTLLFLPALAYLVHAHHAGTLPGSRPDAGLWLYLALGCSLFTTIPLLLFAFAAKRLPLTTVGFLQYVGPTCQFLLAVLWFHEPFTGSRAISLGLIWLGIALFIADVLRRQWTKSRLQPADALVVEEPR